MSISSVFFYALCIQYALYSSVFRRQTGSLTQSVYEYNHQNRMVRSLVIDDEAKTIASARYGYDPLGRRSATVSHTGAVTRYEYNPAGQLAKVQYPESQELRDLQEQEARQHGLFWQEGVNGLSNGHLSSGEYTELSRLLVRMRNGSGFLPVTQLFRTESYTCDANGNRATKTTAYGTITYSYDEENRLLKTCGVSGDGVE